MISVNISQDDIEHYLSKIKAPIPVNDVHVACINSPLNCTLSAPEKTVDAIKEQCDLDEIFAQKLQTGIQYHSPLMETVADEYLHHLGSLDDNNISDLAISMISSVTGDVVPSHILTTAQYWVDNLVSTVCFSKAIITLARGKTVDCKSITDMVEIGPHSALRRPFNDTLQHSSQLGQDQMRLRTTSFRYHTVLARSKSSLQTTLELLGSLFCYGHAVSVSAANQISRCEETVPLLTDYPKYPFDHETKYWNESRFARDYRLRPTSPHLHVLGMRSHDWNPLDPKWRSFFSQDTTSWLREHIVCRNLILQYTFPISQLYFD
jgi:acyl transferase domain-containing protein